MKSLLLKTFKELKYLLFFIPIIATLSVIIFSNYKNISTFILSVITVSILTYILTFIFHHIRNITQLNPFEKIIFSTLKNKKDKGMILSISGSTGSGKSYHIKQLINKLQLSNLSITIYGLEEYAYLNNNNSIHLYINNPLTDQPPLQDILNSIYNNPHQSNIIIIDDLSLFNYSKDEQHQIEKTINLIYNKITTQQHKTILILTQQKLNSLFIPYHDIQFETNYNHIKKQGIIHLIN